MLINWTDVVERYAGNPILKPRDMPKACSSICNSGCVKTPQGEYVMVSRFEAWDKTQHLWISRSKDGFDFKPDPEPMVLVCKPEEQEEVDMATLKSDPGMSSWWDPRVNPVEGDDGFYITYAAVSNDGCRVGLGHTTDFKEMHHVDFPFHVPNRNAVLFPKKFNGMYYMLHRAQWLDGRGNIWFGASPDLKFWGKCRVIARPHVFWEEGKVGPSAPPIYTDKGWLLIYHGVYPTCNGKNYWTGVMLLDLEEPWKVVARASQPIMIPEAPYEVTGQTPNILFPQAIIPEPDGSFKLYYGAADNFVAVGTGKIQDLVDFCFDMQKKD